MSINICIYVCIHIYIYIRIYLSMPKTPGSQWEKNRITYLNLLSETFINLYYHCYSGNRQDPIDIYIYIIYTYIYLDFLFKVFLYGFYHHLGNMFLILSKHLITAC